MLFLMLIHVSGGKCSLNILFIFVSYSHNLHLRPFLCHFSVLWLFDSTCLFILKMDPLPFTAENVTGRTLFSIEKSDLKELGINTLGRRLEVYEKIKQLTSEEKEKVIIVLVQCMVKSKR